MNAEGIDVAGAVAEEQALEAKRMFLRGLKTLSDDMEPGSAGSTDSSKNRIDCDRKKFHNCAAFSVTDRACVCTSCVDGFTGLNPVAGCPISTCFSAASNNCKKCNKDTHLCTSCIDGFTGNAVATSGCPTPCPTIAHCAAGATVDDRTDTSHCVCTTCDPTTFDNCATASRDGHPIGGYPYPIGTCLCTRCIDGFTGLVPASGCPIPTCYDAANVHCATCGTTHNCLVCEDGFTGTDVATRGCPKKCHPISDCLVTPIDDGMSQHTCTCTTCGSSAFRNCATAAYSATNKACECTSCVNGFTGLIPATGCDTPTCYNAASINCKTCDAATHQCTSCNDGFTGFDPASGCATSTCTAAANVHCATCDTTGSTHNCLVCEDGYTGTAIATGGCPISTCTAAANIHCASCDTTGTTHNCLGCIDGFTGNAIATYGCPITCPTIDHCAAGATVDDHTGTFHCVCTTCDPTTFSYDCATAAYVNSYSSGTCICTSCNDGYTGLISASGCPTPTCYNYQSYYCAMCDPISHGCALCLDGTNPPSGFCYPIGSYGA